jgi:hypothetical protein
MPTITPKRGAQKPRGQKSEVRHDKVLMQPGEYEVTKSSTFTIKLPLKKNKENWWVLVSENDAETVEEVVFRMWTYDEMVELRKLATKYDPIRRVHMIDHDLLNRLKMQRYLLSWTFEKVNQRMELHHVGGVISDETWVKVKRLQTNLLKYLIEQMNERYEFGG